ncbi:uncharacterized protein LOC130429522 [Triplophysa dalaica]|uniref:uncharacterized protein LOC130429522 n=1 Tax=Triplophysa dalaica TaxID=1582913 RepID=UPI0024DF9E35|nr:uncharacterized protein LOC130429522 [Triplophysa dalaica]
MDLWFIFLAYLPYFIAKGVFGDEVKSVSVMEGQNVTLHTDTQLQTDDVILWNYRPKNTVVAIINWKAKSIKLSDDERFRDRLEVNNQTGDLTISDVKTTESGLYTLMINRNNEISNKIFNLTVNGNFLPLNHITKPTQDLHNTELNNKSSESPDQWLIVITAVVVSVLCVIIIIIIISIIMKKRKVSGNSSESQNHLTDEIINISSAAHLKMKNPQSV